MGEVSRRSFLKGAGVLGVGTLAASTFLTGCSNQAGTKTETSAERAGGHPVQVHEADVVVVGGGIAGAMAARRALGKGLSVSVIDKGPWGHSGTSGINWGHNAETNEWADGDGSDTLPIISVIYDGMVNQVNGLAMCQAVHAGRPCATFEQAGCVLERGKENHTAAQNAKVPFVVDNGTFNRYFCLELSRKGADVHDRTMVVELLQDSEGKAAGVVALDLVSGSAHVFRGKAVVFAMGSYRWVSGFNGLKPHTIAGPENTGDGLAILLRKGVSMRDMEEQPIDFVQWTPLATRQGMGAMGASTINWKFMYDKNEDKLVPDSIESVSNGQLARLYYRAQLEGRGTENGGVYVDTSDPHADDRYYRRTSENQKRFLNYELPKFTEVVAEQWEDAGHPFEYSAEAETQIPGLFYASSGQGSWAGCGFFGAFGSGYMAGEGAAAKATDTKVAPSVDWDAVEVALNDAYGLLEAEPGSPIRSTVVFRSVQEAYWSGLSPLRDEAGITATIDELKRIEKEDFPKMYVPLKSRQFNTDWHRALEVKGMLMCARATAEAALIRKECRGAHVRSDFPIQDNENYLASTKVSFSDDAWSASLEQLDDSLIPLDTLKTMVPQFNLQ